MDVAPLIQYLNHRGHVIVYTYLSAAALFIYDYILTLRLEIKFIWLSSWTYTKVLFLLIRYLAFAHAILYIVNHALREISAEMCRVTFSVEAWCIAIQVLLSEAVLCIRTWAVWRRNKVVGIGLTVLIVAYLISVCILVNGLIQSVKFGPPPFSGFRGCFIIKPPAHMWAIYVPATAIHSIILALMVTSALRLYRQGLSGELSHVIHRDGILFYVYLLCFTAATLVFIFALPPDLTPIFIPLQDILYGVLTTRIILNIREASSRDIQTELHTGTYEPAAVIMPLTFRPGVDDRHNDDATTLSHSWTDSQDADLSNMQAP